MPVLILIVVGLILYYTYKNNEKKKKQLLEQERREAENARQRKLEQEFREAQERAKDIINEEWFIKLYNKVNEQNKSFKDVAKAVYDCYPFSSFTIQEEYVFGGYFEMKIENGVQLNYQFAYVYYKDIGIRNLNNEEQRLAAIAFGLKEGYVYANENSVLLDKNYWGATKSTSDIVDVYNS